MAQPHQEQPAETPGSSDDVDEHDHTAPHAVSRRAVVLGIALVLVLAIGLVLLLGKAAGYRHALDACESASTPWLIACFVLAALSCAGYLVRCVRWRRWMAGPGSVR